ncbi:MAG: radical SAM protein [Phycisphaerales bacterium]
MNGASDQSRPCVLGQTALEFGVACKQAGLPGGAIAAMERYARAFRLGLRDDPLAPVAVAPIERLHLRPSPEGDVVKFTQRIARSPALPPAATALATPDTSAPLEIESVLIPMVGKKRSRSYTLCLSSQVGCAMGCGFCQTAQMGLIRSLSAAEIVGQWFAARHLIERPDQAASIRNIVFMGMGEPMDNLSAVLRAVSILTDPRGPAIAMSRITISTVGRLDGIEALAERVRTPGWHRLGLAVSLNAPTDEIRSALMPINRSAPLAVLRSALLRWPFHSGVHHCLEYVLIPGVNAAPDHADALAAFVLGDDWPGTDPAIRRFPGAALRGVVNVIPYNPRDQSPWPAPAETTVTTFMERLSAQGVYVKRRRTKGRDTMAACGQLGNPALRRTSLTVRAAQTAATMPNG